MKTGIFIVCAAAVVLPALQAQPGCPLISFLQGVSDNSFAGEQNRSILARQPDGSFTDLTYVVNAQSAQPITKSGSVGNYQQSLLLCAGLGASVRHSAAGNLKADPQGINAEAGPVAADLAGNGTGVLLGFWPRYFGDQLIVAKASADYSVPSAPIGYPVGPQPGGIIVADFNGDGKKDVAVVYTGPVAGGAQGGISLLLGNGDGTLKPAVNYPALGNALEAAVFDFNGDGLPDLVLAGYNSTIKVLLGNRDGTLHAGNSYTVNAFDVTSLAIADVDGDGKADILAFSSRTGILVLNGKGDGTFQIGTALPLNLSFGSIGTGDFNKDGITDIVVNTSGSGVSVLLGTGGGKFSPPTVFAAPGDGDFFVEDFDGDGNLDLVFSEGHPDALTSASGVSSSGVIAVLFGRGDGTFAGPTVAQLDGNMNDQTQAPTNVVVADFNGDGKPDLATSNASGKSVSVLLGKGAGSFQAPKSITTGAVLPNSIAAGDFNADGKPDLVITDGTANIGILVNNGDGTFPTPIMIPVNGTTPKFVVVGDFDGDKKLDLAVVNAGSNNISVMLGNGNGSFKTPVNIAVGTNPVNLIAGDFNGDGKLDLAVANNGTFSAAGTNTGSISVFLGKGDGTFQAATNYPASQYPVFVTTADINGDKKLDLVVASKGANGQDQLAVLLGNGNGTFQPALLMNTEFAPSSIVVADFSGDGKLDLIVTHCCGSNNLTFLVGNGDGTFQPETPFAASSSFFAATGDFNADGKPDLAVTSFSLGSPHVVTTFLNISVAQGSLVITSAAGNPLQAPPIAQFSIATAKGIDLATGVQVNSAITPPTSMQNTTASVQDALGVSRPAPLFYVSPGQVNFLIPQGTAVGNATVTITSGDGFVSVGTVAVAAVAPSIFTLNSNSLVAAYVQRVRVDTSQSIEYLYAVDGGGNVIFPLVDMGPSTDQVYLNLFGTGIQGRSSLAGVSITVGNVPTPTLYAGASTYPGEDQVAILVPRSLAGTGGPVNIVIKVDGKQANTTTLNIK